MSRGTTSGLLFAVLVSSVGVTFSQGCSRSSGSKKGAPAPLVIDTTTLPDGGVGAPYSETLSASGGALPYTWSIQSGTPPPGITLSPAGVLSGTPTTPGLYSFTVAVQDPQNPPATATADLDLLIVQPVVTIQTTSLPDAFVGMAYATTLAASGGLLPYTWTITGGTLPAGLNLAATGDITGTPTTPGVETLTFQVSDSSAPSATDTVTLDLLVFTPPGANSPPDANAGTITGTQRGLVEFRYTLTDMNSDPVTLDIDFSTDSGLTYQAATSGPGGAGKGPLVSSPALGLLMFLWDSETDIGQAFVTTVRLRVTPKDAEMGLPSETNDFTVDNRPGNALFTATMSMRTARMEHTATLLTDGTVLVAGGIGTGDVVLDRAELWDPVRGIFWHTLGRLTTPRARHTATLFPDGRVLLVAGISSASGPELDSAEIYDPTTEQFQSTGALSVGRIAHAAAPGGAGALVSGGYNALSPGSFDDIQEYDLAGSIFGLPSTLLRARSYHTATALPGGNVLLVGGSGTQTISAEEFDPVTGASPVQHTIAGYPEVKYHAASLLQNGLVLVSGGAPGDGVVSVRNALENAFTYDSTTGFTDVGGMVGSRRRHTSTTLLDGRVLVAGGEQDQPLQPQAASEIYEVGIGFGSTGPMTLPRMHHTAIGLPDGRVLIMGGTSNGADPLAEAEMYHP